MQGRSGDGVSLTARTPSDEQKIDGSDILVAAGRVPNTAGIGLEETGVELNAHGYIRVNERLETTAPNLWAIGECAGSPQFTHVSIDDFRIIRPSCRILSGFRRGGHITLGLFACSQDISPGGSDAGAIHMTYEPVSSAIVPGWSVAAISPNSARSTSSFPDS